MVGSTKILFDLFSFFRPKYALIIVILLAAAACNLTLGVSRDGANPFAAYTEVARTRAYLWTGMAPTSYAGTQIPAGSGEVTTAPINPSATPTGTPSSPCNRAQFLGDVNYPDGSEVLPGTPFTKTWRMKNIGSCTWTAEYSLVFNHGDRMDAPPSTPIALGMVPPGAETTVSVDLVAPASKGTYQGYFFLRSPEGQLFGIGSDGLQSFRVKIVVKSPIPTNTPTAQINIPPLAKSRIVIPLFVGFSAQFVQRAACGVRRMGVFKVTNTGTLTIESLHIELQGPVGTMVLSSDQDKPFRSAPVQPYPECANEAGDNLNPRSEAINTTLPNAGTSGRAIIKMCSQNGLAGECEEKTLDFTW
jgi:hypothetical protein